MKDRLIIFKLKIKSSFNQNIELPGDEAFDTLQFYSHDQDIWRIKTFVIDHDIHIYKVNLGEREVVDVVKFLIESTKSHYGDVIDSIIELQLKNTEDHKSANEFFKKHDLNPNLESSLDFAFWNPDNQPYRTQSRPL